MMIIGAPMMAPAMPHTCENSMTVSNNTSGEMPIFAPERLGSTSEPNTCWLPMSKASMNTAVNGSIMIKPMRTGGMVAKSAPKMGMKSSKKHKTPNKNQPGMLNPTGERMMVITIAWPPLQVTLETT